jgi:hypothetical protein
VNQSDAARRVGELRSLGVFGGLQTGAVLHASLETIPDLPASAQVLLISGDTGWKSLTRLGELARAGASASATQPEALEERVGASS